MIELPSLEQLCLCNIRNDLHSFPVLTLSLLSYHCRHSLLCALPAADICKLEEFPQFIQGIDMNLVWKNLLDYFVNLLFDRTPVWSPEKFGPYLKSEYLLPSAKENFLAMISKLLFLTTECKYEKLEYFDHGKCKLVAALLFGMPSNEYCHNCIPIVTLGRLPTHIPSRYDGCLADESHEDIAQMISQIMSVFKRGPTMIQLCIDEGIDDNLVFVNDQVLAPLLSTVEVFGVYFLRGNYEESEPYCDLLKKIVSSQLCSLSQSEYALHTLRFEGYQTNLKLTLDNLKESSLLSYASHHHGCNWNEPVCGDKNPYTKLKKVELTVSDPSCELAEHGIEGMLNLCCDTIAAILYSQETLEVFNLTDWFSVQFSRGGCYFVYSGFEMLYFFLPLIVARPDFKSLKLDGCSLPVNALQNIIRTFLCTPTAHPQSLDLNRCSLYNSQPISLPKGCPEPPIIPSTAPCMNSNLKSLSLFVNNGLSSFTWLLSHPNMNLKHLDLYCNPTTVDMAIKWEMIEPDYSSTDECESYEESGNEEGAPGPKRQRIVEGKNDDCSQKDGMQLLCDFICKLDQPEKLDIHFISTDALSASAKHLENSIISAEYLSPQAKETLERVRLLPALEALSFETRHWSLADSYYGIPG